MILKVVLLLFAAVLFIDAKEVHAHAGFISQNGSTFYQKEDGTFQTGLANIEGKIYFFGEYTGKLQKGHITSAFTGKQYYASEEGLLQSGFVKDGNTTYYFDPITKEMLKGLQVIDGKEYFLGEYSGRLLQGAITSTFTGKQYYASEEGLLQGGFVKDGNATYYFDPTTKEMLKGIQVIDGKEYFLGEYSGKVQVGFLTSAFTGHHYYTDQTGLIQKGTQKIAGKKYYFDETTGILQFGFLNIENETYYAGSTGAFLTGEHTIAGKNYRFTTEGILYQGFRTFTDGTYYYINGYLQRGITVIDGQSYFLGEVSGKVQVGFVTSSITGKTYYTDASGKILKGIQLIDGNLYFLGEYSGIVQTGLIQSSATGDYYYADQNGQIYQNVFTLNEKTYYANEQGILLEGFQKLDTETYYLIHGAKQFGITKIDGVEYFLGEYSGRVMNGLVISAFTGDRYYTDSLGRILKGIQTIDGTRYFCGEISGKLQIGWITALTGQIYYTNSDGVIQTGVQTIDGRVYLFDTNGVIQTGFQTINGNTYYYNYDGSIATGVQTIHGRRYRFAQDGVLKDVDFKLIADVSYYQQNIDWDTLWNSKQIDGVILRIGYNDVEDRMFATYLANVRRLNIPYGIYLFSYAHNPGEAIFEANATINMLRKYNVQPTYPIYYDIESYRITSMNESSDDISQEAYEGIITNYINTLRMAGYDAKVYTGLNYAMTRFTAAARQYVDWIAHYTTGECGYALPHRGWQFTSQASLPGIQGNVDLSIFYY